MCWECVHIMVNLSYCDVVCMFGSGWVYLLPEKDGTILDYVCCL